MDQKAALVYVVSGKAVYKLVGFRLFADSNVLRFTVYAIRSGLTLSLSLDDCMYLEGPHLILRSFAEVQMTTLTPAPPTPDQRPAPLLDKMYVVWRSVERSSAAAIWCQ